jgi:hypothetical protein
MTFKNFKNNLAAFSKLIGPLWDQSPNDLLINAVLVPLTGCLLINAIVLLAPVFNIIFLGYGTLLGIFAIGKVIFSGYNKIRAKTSLK